MSPLRDIKRAARLRLHAGMGVAALYLPSQGATPVPCTVRVHTKFAALGDRFDGAERAEAEPKIIFLASEVPGPRPQMGIVSVEPGEAYRIVSADPADDITVTATVTRLSAAQATGLPVPTDYPTPTTPSVLLSAGFSGGGFGTIDYTDLDDGTDLFLPANEWVKINRRLVPSAANFNLPRGPWKDFEFFRDGLLRARAKGDFYLYKFSYVVIPNVRGSTVRFSVQPGGDRNFEFGPSAVAIDDDAGYQFANSTTFGQQARSRFVTSGAEIQIMLTTDGVLRRFSPEVTPLTFP